MPGQTGPAWFVLQGQHGSVWFWPGTVQFNLQCKHSINVHNPVHVHVGAYVHVCMCHRCFDILVMTLSKCVYIHARCVYMYGTLLDTHTNYMNIQARLRLLASILVILHVYVCAYMDT